jgi:hypothetical protein
MKKTIVSTVSVVLAVICLLCFVSCGADGGDLWANATYKSDATVGEGAKIISVIIETPEKVITLSVHTNMTTLGAALYQYGLINDISFFDELNGIVASWDKDQAYWAFYEGETLMPHGVNDENIGGGEAYRFVYTK